MAVCKPSQLQRYRSGTEIESTETGNQEEQDARQAGCDAYLVKPVLDWGQLRQTVTALLARGPRP